MEALRNPVYLEKLRQFLQKMCELYGTRLDPQDRYMAAWEAYLEVDTRDSPGKRTYNFWDDVFLRVRDRLVELQREQNRLRALESSFSLNQPGPDGKGEALEWVNPGTGDFVNRVMFWDFLSRLSKRERRVALQYIQRCPEDEICQNCRMRPQELRNIRGHLKRHLEIYEAL